MLSVRGDNNPNIDENTLTTFRISPVQSQMVKINTMYIYDIERAAGEFQPNLAQSILNWVK